LKVPFNKPFQVGNELQYINHAIELGEIKGDGFYTKQCSSFLEQYLPCKKALITHSCTAALEIAAILLDLQEGDEVIMPSYTFVSTANAFVLRGAVPVFVDIRHDTLNIDEARIEAAITNKTRAICVVHYAGVSCAMTEIMALAKKYNLAIIEDAAQALGSFYKGRALGTLGDLGCFSFHETKNIISGEGGSLIINNDKYIERAEIIREKGTNRSQFFRGEVDKYTWVDIGSSYLPSDIISAYLYAQFENIEKINKKRMEIWHEYHNFFEKYEQLGYINRQHIPFDLEHNAHMYYILFSKGLERQKCIDIMKKHGVNPVFHYIPLHSSPAGIKYARFVGSMDVTDKVSGALLRMPIYYNIGHEAMSKVKSAFQACVEEYQKKFVEKL
jgi:dTDP-4-amino-4,6-dideoxygalactose transaminase